MTKSTSTWNHSERRLVSHALMLVGTHPIATLTAKGIPKMCFGVSARHPCARVCFITVILVDTSWIVVKEPQIRLPDVPLCRGMNRYDITRGGSMRRIVIQSPPRHVPCKTSQGSIFHLERFESSRLRARRSSKPGNQKAAFGMRIPLPATHSVNSTCWVAPVLRSVQVP